MTIDLGSNFLHCLLVYTSSAANAQLKYNLKRGASCDKFVPEKLKSSLTIEDSYSMALIRDITLVEWIFIITIFFIKHIFK